MKFRITEVCKHGRKMYRPEKMVKFLWFTYWEIIGIYVFSSVECAEEVIKAYKNMESHKPKVVKEV